jgi:DNA repair/transcription protein MET18/MMS19
MGDESLVGIIDLVNGEKDPRNLMLVFSMCRVLLLEWDISNHAETLFDSVYAYFPITFRPPPNDPYGITAQDLKDRLRDCISSTKHLAPYAIPNLLDKLDSTSPVVKVSSTPSICLSILMTLQKDVLRTLLACTETYDAQAMSQYSITLWDALKFEVLSAQEPDLAEEALVVLQSIARCLSNSTQMSATASPLAQYIRPIVKETVEHLQEPTQRQAKASGDILKAVSAANPESFNLVAKGVVAPIITIYQTTTEIAKQRALLEVLRQLFDSAIEVFGSWRSNNFQPKMENSLEAFSESFLQIFGQALMGTILEEVSFRVAAALGLQRLTTIRNLLQDNEIGMIIQHFDEIVLYEEPLGRDDLKRTAMESLAEISKHKPRLIMDITFPAFMAQLPDTDSEAEAKGDYHTTLEGLAEISVEKEVFDTLVRRLLNKLDVLLQSRNVETPRYTCAILSTMLFIMERKGLEGDPNIQTYFDRILVGLISKAAAAATESKDLTALNDGAVLEVLGRVGNLIIRRSSPEKKTLICSNVYDLFSLQSGLDKLSHAPEGSHLQRIWIVSTWLLAAVPRDFRAPLLEIPNIAAILDQLLAVLAQEISPIPFLAISRQVGLYINKHLPPAHLDIATSHLRVLHEKLPLSHSQALEGVAQDQSERLIRIIFSVSRALILRLAPITNAILGDLLSLLDASRYPEHINKIAASGFGSLLAPDAVLSKTNGAQIRLLAPQRVFQTLTPMIAAAFKTSSSGTVKENYLTALSGIIATVPSDIVVPELPTLLPLLLQSLDLTDQQVKTATLETLAVVIATNPSPLEESGHIPSLVKRLIKASSIPKAPAKNATTPDTPKARQLAVRCLFLMPSHIKGSTSRTNPLLPLKREVLQGLMKVLDDPKRDVRKEAVDARGAWLRGVDDVEEDSD